MAMQQRYFKLNEADSFKYHKEYLEKIGKPRKKTIRDFLSACNAVGYLSHQHFGTEHISALLVRGGWTTAETNVFPVKNLMTMVRRCLRSGQTVATKKENSLRPV